MYKYILEFWKLEIILSNTYQLGIFLDLLIPHCTYLLFIIILIGSIVNGGRRRWQHSPVKMYFSISETKTNWFTHAHARSNVIIMYLYKSFIIIVVYASLATRAAWCSGVYLNVYYIIFFSRSLSVHIAPSPNTYFHLPQTKYN